MTQYIDNDTTAAARFWRRIQDFASHAKVWDSDAIFYRLSRMKSCLTLISRGFMVIRDEYLAVMAAAGIELTCQEISKKRLFYLSRLD